MLPAFAVFVRDLVKYFRSPAMLSVALLLPLLQLVVIGYAIGGRIRDVEVAVVDQDGGTEALRIREKLLALETATGALRITSEASAEKATADVRNGRRSAAIVIPPDYTRDLYRGASPKIGVVVDNTDVFVAGALAERLRAFELALNQRAIDQRALRAAAVGIVELYPYVEYIQYLLPGAVILGIYLSCLIGGGILYIDDKSKGIHEGYLASPASSLQLLAGMIGAGTAKATLAGVFVAAAGAWIAGALDRVTFTAALTLLPFILVVSVAMVCLISATMIRVRDPLVARATFSVMNIVFFFPSGAVYPIAGFPGWLRAASAFDPFTYAVRGFRSLLLRGTGPAAITEDLAALAVFGLVAFSAGWLLFPRRL